MSERPAFLPLESLGQGTPDLSWQERALCAQTDPEAFFPEKGGSTREAKRVCLSCDVRSECLEYALGRAVWYLGRTFRARTPSPQAPFGLITSSSF
jgi:WhiB family transcriptional regulator, redox-sensing transcriptional regulator